MLIQLRDTGFNWLPPRHYNRQHPKPAVTPQSEFLRRYLGQLELARLRELQKHDPSYPELPHRIRDYQAGIYYLTVPSQAKDYVFYLAHRSLAFVVSACPLEATGNFWKSRLEQY